MNNKILITPRSLSQGAHSEFQPLIDAGYEMIMPTPGKMPTEADLIEAICDVKGWLAGIEPVSQAVIDAAPHLKVISRNGTGVDNLPLALLAERNIAVERAEGTNARGVAELALSLIFAGLRNIIPTHEGIRKGQWPRKSGREICDSIIGIIGLGAIGKILAELTLALGANVIAYDPYAPDDTITHKRFKRGEFMDVIKQADAISLHAPIAKNAPPLINADILAQSKADLILVNTARAGLVDDNALLKALDSGHVASYLTDVFDTEPPLASPLTQHEKVVMTSHIGGFTTASVSRSTQAAVANLLKVLQ